MALRHRLCFICIDKNVSDSPAKPAIARTLLVVDDDGRLVGLVSMDDILDLLIGELKDIGELLQRESPAVLARA